ncbi:MAG: hypothetical protein J6Y55_00740 [Bacteroidales bacterium]|nr:hypothetical protein [Bacteroidales bacterium]
MREPIRDSERLHHILNACNLLINRQAQDSIALKPMVKKVISELQK